MLTNINLQKLDLASKMWLRICIELGVNIVAPFTLRDEKLAFISIAFLPDFGGKNGMIIGAVDFPLAIPDELFCKKAREKGLYVSCIDVGPYVKGTVTETDIKEILVDWGYYGPDVRRPGWLSTIKNPWTT